MDAAVPQSLQDACNSLRHQLRQQGQWCRGNAADRYRHSLATETTAWEDGCSRVGLSAYLKTLQQLASILPQHERSNPAFMRGQIGTFMGSLAAWHTAANPDLASQAWRAALPIFPKGHDGRAQAVIALLEINETLFARAAAGDLDIIYTNLRQVMSVAPHERSAPHTAAQQVIILADKMPAGDQRTTLLALAKRYAPRAFERKQAAIRQEQPTVAAVQNNLPIYLLAGYENPSPAELKKGLRAVLQAPLDRLSLNELVKAIVWVAHCITQNTARPFLGQSLAARAKNIGWSLLRHYDTLAHVGGLPPNLAVEKIRRTLLPTAPPDSGISANIVTTTQPIAVKKHLQKELFRLQRKLRAQQDRLDQHRRHGSLHSGWDEAQRLITGIMGFF